MVQKPLILLSFLIAAIASAFILDGYSAPNARAQKPGAEAISPSVGQKSYPTIGSNYWHSPDIFGRSRLFNTPVLINNEGGNQHLALISRDTLSPPSSKCSLGDLEGCGMFINKPGREFGLVVQWSLNELSAWAYEKLEEDNTPPKLPEPPKSGSIPQPIFSDKATIITYTPSSEVNEGLYQNLTWKTYCGSTSCSLSEPQKPVPPVITIPPPCPPPSDEAVIETLPNGTVRTRTIETHSKDPSCEEFRSSVLGSQPPTPKPSATPAPKPPVIPRITVYVGSQEFQLDGKEGVFPISASLAKALREAKSSTVKIITPRKWEATINPDAVKNLSVIYQESGSSRTQR